MSGVRWTSEQKDLDEGARQSAPGAFVRLAQGYTHYEENGRRGLRSVILVHGFLVPYLIWDRTVPALHSAGLHSIRYDLYGRGLSDRPDTAYDMTLFVDQLTELADALACGKIDLVGLSMGAPIAAAFAVSRPERVRRVVLIDPSGVGPGALGALRAVTFLPGMRATLMRVCRSGYLLEKLAAHFYHPAEVLDFRERCQNQMEYRGFARTVVSAVRNGMLGNFDATYRQLGGLHKDILLIWGEDDPTIPIRHSRRLLELLPGAQFVSIPKAGHIPHVDHAEAVNSRLLQFLN